MHFFTACAYRIETLVYLLTIHTLPYQCCYDSHKTQHKKLCLKHLKGC